MALIDHHKRVIFLGEFANLVHRCDVAVHREHTVSADDAEPLGLSLFEATLQIFHVGVRITITDGFAKTHTVDNGRVVERVGDDSVFSGQQRLEDSAVGVETRGVKNGVFSLEEFRDGFLKLLVEILSATDEAHGAHSKAPLVHRLLGGLDKSRGISQAQIVIGAEVKRLAAVLESDLGGLGRSDVPFVLVEAGFLDGCEICRTWL